MNSDLRRAALDARQHRSALRRLLASLAEPTSEQRLDQLRAAVRAEESQAAQSLPASLPQEPKELASTAPRKRRAAESLDLEEPATLVPRFRLLLPEEERVSILAVAADSQCEGVVAVLLSSGLLELWKADPICWHLTCTVQVPLPQKPQGTLTFSRSGNHLWMVTCGEGPLHTRLFERMGGVVQLAVLQGPSQGLRAGPALLSPNGLALGLKDVHVLRWTGEALEIVSSFPAAPTPREQDRRFSLWPLPPLGEEPSQWRLVMHCEGLGFGVLRLLDALGQILASVQLTGSIVVPPQDPHPCCPSSFLLLVASVDWSLHSVTVENGHLELKRLAMLSPAEEVEVLAVSEGSVAFESHGSFWLLDWQPRQLHALPPDWRPVAVRNRLLILERAGCELLFLEPD